MHNGQLGMLYLHSRRRSRIGRVRWASAGFLVMLPHSDRLVVAGG